MARIVVFIRQMADRLAQLETRDYTFSVPFTTMQTGLIRGGIAVNIVPKECEFVFEARTLPGASERKLFQEVQDYAAILLPETQRVEPNARIEFEMLNTAPGMNMQESDEIVKLMERGWLNKAQVGRWGQVLHSYFHSFFTIRIMMCCGRRQETKPGTKRDHSGQALLFR